MTITPEALLVVKAIIGLIILIAAYLAHSPLGSKLPKSVVSALAWLAKQDTTGLYAIFDKLMLSREERRQLAVEWLVERTKAGPFPLSEQEAGALADFVQREYDAGRKWLQGKGK